MSKIEQELTNEGELLIEKDNRAAIAVSLATHLFVLKYAEDALKLKAAK